MPGRSTPQQSPAWVRWIAQDADGTWWGFEHEPNRSDRAWYENEVGRCVRLAGDEPNPAWQQTLRRASPAADNSAS